MRASARAFGALLLLSVSLSDAAQAAASDNVQAMTALFRRPVPTPALPARHTFVFWVNGDADHFTTQDSSGGTSSNSVKVRRADAIEVERIEKIAASCENCNVVLLHDQRGSDHWYTASQPWAVQLKIFSRGMPLLKRHVSEIDLADSRVLTGLLAITKAVFPRSEIHLIYRGHPFERAPFDYSHPDHLYGSKRFLQSLRGVPFADGLASVTFAACQMASLSWIKNLAPLTRFWIASEVEILETLDTGFRFDVLNQITDHQNARQVSRLLAQHILDARLATDPMNDGMLEAPTTWIDVRAAQMLEAKLYELIQSADLPQGQSKDALNFAALSKNASSEYLAALTRAGKSEQSIELLSQVARIIYSDTSQLDVGLLLKWIESRQSAPLPKISSIREILDTAVVVTGGSPVQPKAGLSLQIQHND